MLARTADAVAGARVDRVLIEHFVQTEIGRSRSSRVHMTSFCKQETMYSVSK